MVKHFMNDFLWSFDTKYQHASPLKLELICDVHCAPTSIPSIACCFRELDDEDNPKASLTAEENHGFKKIEQYGSVL